MLLTRRLPGLIYTYRYAVYSFCILALLSLYLLYRWNFICTNLEAWQHVNKMCELYGTGQAVGSLCHPLCVIKEVHSLTCHSFRAKKEAVFSAEWHNTRLVFKSASNGAKLDGVLNNPTENAFLDTIRALVRSRLNATLAHDFVMRLSRLPAYEDQDKRQTEMDNLWILVQDNEYLLSTVYADKHVFPQVFGTCGPYFAVEYVEPLQEISSMLTMADSRQDWGRRLKIAVQILELLEELDSSFREPFHLCDLKIGHFGVVNNEKKLKFIDLHAVYPKSVINRIISNRIHCQKDEDCDFLDCRARCGKNGKCNSFVENNNLQIVCEKIFLGWRISNTIIIPGLLMSQHTPAELASVLRQCANPDGEEGKPRAAPDEETRKRLYNILSEIEQSVNNDFFL